MDKRDRIFVFSKTGTGGGEGHNFFRTLTILTLVAVLSTAIGCSEWRAERAFKRAVEMEKAKPTRDVLLELNKIVERWPMTRAAGKARKEIEWLSDLQDATTRGKGLLAWDSVRKVARAAEQFRVAKGRYPENMEEMIPRFLSGEIRDPWGTPVGYRKTASGYQAICFGADGIPGGTGDDADINIVNGQLSDR